MTNPPKKFLSDLNLRKGDMVKLKVSPDPGLLTFNQTVGSHHWFIDTDGCSRDFQVKKAGEIEVLFHKREVAR